MICIELCFSTTAQDITSKHSQVTALVKNINEDSLLEKVTLENEAFMPQMTDGGGELTGYYKNGIIQRVTREIGLSFGINTFNYYYLNGNLVFIYETLHGFLFDDKTGSVDPGKTELNFIGRYYFKNNKLLDYETVGHNRFEIDGIDMEKLLLAEAKENLVLLERARKLKPGKNN